MLTIDHFIHSNRGRGVDPAQKGLLALLTLSLCLLLDRPAVGLLACVWMWAIVALWAGLPSHIFGRVLFGQGAFLLIGVAAIAATISLGSEPELPLSWWVQMGPMVIGTSLESMDRALSIATRALGCVAAMDFLVLTTPLVDIVDLLRRVRVPNILIDVVTLTCRFIFVLIDSVDRMHTAQDSRLGYSSLRSSMSSLGLLGSRLFVESYQRSKRLEIALESRGFAGDLRVLPASYRFDHTLWWLGLAVVASQLIGWILL